MTAAPYWSDGQVTLYQGDCLDVLAGMEAGSADAIVTDPPGAIGFMGRDWDGDRGGRDKWIGWLAERMEQAARVLKPGGHALVWALPRTSGWTQIALEDAGFEVRDSIAHIFGSGFPKSVDVSKAIDKAAGAEREITGVSQFASRKPHGTWTGEVYGDEPGHGQGPSVTAPATEDAARWEGWGTALKPAHEVWWLARKPLAGTVAQNVLEHGTGGLNIDGCRVEPTGESRARVGEPSQESRYADRGSTDFAALPGTRGGDPAGRWPPNVVLGPDAAAELDRQSGVLTSGDGAVNRQSAKGGARSASIGAESRPEGTPMISYGDSGGASRFFPVFRYQAKAGSAERPRAADGNAHPTVKSLPLVQWLVRLITPPGGLVLDLFAGSGPTAEACIIEGFPCVLIEKDPASCELIRIRLRKDIQPAMFGQVS
jgi:DNA methylase